MLRTRCRRVAPGAAIWARFAKIGAEGETTCGAGQQEREKETAAHRPPCAHTAGGDGAFPHLPSNCRTRGATGLPRLSTGRRVQPSADDVVADVVPQSLHELRRVGGDGVAMT